jgi:phosphoenolpyruvate carboxylase
VFFLYFQYVYNHPKFVEYFRAATPQLELGIMNIGSRPSKRPNLNAGIEALRAIPWVFAWTQTRFHLPVWLGIGTALKSMMDKGLEGELQKMYVEWPFFHSTLDLVQMVLYKADPNIAKWYTSSLVPQDLQFLGAELETELETCIACILKVTKQRTLMENNPVERRSVESRLPFTDPLNCLQIEILKKLRAGNQDPILQDILVLTIQGISLGMGNTG